MNIVAFGSIAGNLLIVVVAVFGAPRVAFCQESKLYLGGSLMGSWQGSERPGDDPSFPQSGVGGNAIGGVGEVGGFVARSLSISAEVSVPARFESTQQIIHFPVSRTQDRHRDLVFSGLLHLHWLTDRAVHMSFNVGASAVREDTLLRTAYQVPFSAAGDFGPFGPERPLTRWTVALTSGVDAGIQISPRISIVPQFRLHWIKRADADSGTDNGFLGLGPLVVRPALGVRLTF
jgi:hypothetical protein